jgi:hypothetical protein
MIEFDDFFTVRGFAFDVPQFSFPTAHPISTFKFVFHCSTFTLSLHLYIFLHDTKQTCFFFYAALRLYIL